MIWRGLDIDTQHVSRACARRSTSCRTFSTSSSSGRAQRARCAWSTSPARTCARPRNVGAHTRTAPSRQRVTSQPRLKRTKRYGELFCTYAYPAPYHPEGTRSSRISSEAIFNGGHGAGLKQTLGVAWQAACNVEGEQISKIVDVVQRGLQSKGTYYTTAVSSPPLLACVSIDRRKLCSALLAVKYCYNRV